MLREANLIHAKLQGANLVGANLSKAELQEAFLEKANLQGVYRYQASRTKVISIVTRYSAILPFSTFAFCSIK